MTLALSQQRVISEQNMKERQPFNSILHGGKQDVVAQQCSLLSKKTKRNRSKN
jgi:hypothetical protein